MRGPTGFLYWLVAGAVVGFGLIGLMSIGFPFLIIGIVLCVVGVWRPGIGGSWAFLIGLGGLPALVFLRHIIDAALNPNCSGDVSTPDVGTVTCYDIPASYYVLFAISVAITLSGVALFLFLRARSRDGATA